MKTEPKRTIETFELENSTYYLDEMEDGTFGIAKDEHLIESEKDFRIISLKFHRMRNNLCEAKTKQAAEQWNIEHEPSTNRTGAKTFIVSGLRTIARVYGYRNGNKLPHLEENAKLIAAAPAMLEGLQLIIKKTYAIIQGAEKGWMRQDIIKEANSIYELADKLIEATE